DPGPVAGHAAFLVEIEADGAMLDDAAPQNAHARQVGGQQRIRLLRLDTQRAGIYGRDIGELLHDGGIGAGDGFFIVHGPAKREDDVLRSKWLAVRELYALAQVEFPGGVV